MLDRATLSELTALYSGPRPGAAEAETETQTAGSATGGGRKLVLPIVFLVLGLLMAASFVAGTIVTLTDGEISTTDIVRSVIIGIAVLAIGGRSLVFLLNLGPGRVLGSVLRTLHPQAPAAPGPPPPILDRTQLGQLGSLAPAGFGRHSLLRQGRRATWEVLSLITWYAVLIAVMVFLGFAIVLLVLAIGRAVADENVEYITIIEGAILGLASFGLVMLIQLAIATWNDRRRRRRGYLLQRLSRYLLRFLDGTARHSTAGVNAVSSAGATAGGLAVATAAVALLAFSPVLAEGVGITGGGSGGSGGSIVREFTPTPDALEATSTPRPSGSPGAGGSATPGPSPSASATPTPTPAGGGGNGSNPGSTTQPGQPATPLPTAPPPVVTATPFLPPAYCPLDNGVRHPTGSATAVPDLAQRIFDLTNQYRADRGQPVLQPSESLRNAANQQARFVLLTRWWELYSGSVQIHCNDEAQDQLDRAIAFGYPPALVTENVAWGSANTSAETFLGYLATGEDPADPRVHSLGVGCFRRDDTQEIACTQVFGE